jgi:hypothetical protein
MPPRVVFVVGKFSNVSDDSHLEGAFRRHGKVPYRK